jgi:hypothetical protein
MKIRPGILAGPVFSARKTQVSQRENRLTSWHSRPARFSEFGPVRGVTPMRIRAGSFGSTVSMLVSVALSLAACCESFAIVLRVPSEHLTIQAAIDDANNGDIVLVAPGTYTGDGNRDIEFKGKAITVRSETGPETCIIDCQGSEVENHRGVCFRPGSHPVNICFDGFTVKNGFISKEKYPEFYPYGGGIFCLGGSPTIRNCIITNNHALGGGGGLWCSGDNTRVINCIIRNNTVEYGSGAGIHLAYGSQKIEGCLIADNAGGAGLSIYDLSEASVINCTIVANHSRYQGGGVHFSPGDGRKCIITNTIIWGNTAAVGGDQIGGGWERGGGRETKNVSFRYCFIQAGINAVYWPHKEYQDFDWKKTMKEGVVFADDPGFADPNNGDYHLKSQTGRWDPVGHTWVRDSETSPCIDAGDPNSPVGEEPFPNGGRMNMGAYGGTAVASKSYFGKPPCQTVISGDVNGDCRVDFIDLAILAHHWLEEG